MSEAATPGFWRARPSAPQARLDFDYLFVSIIIGCALFLRPLGGIGGLVFIAAAGIFFLAQPARIRDLGRSYPLLGLGGLSVLSTLWSQYPSQTAYYGIQYALTILLGCQIGTAMAEDKLLYGVFTGFLLFGLINLGVGLADGGITLAGFYDHPAFTGLMSSKNAQADVAALGTMVALATMIEALRRHSRLVAFLAVALICANGLIIANAQSAGAIVSVGVGGIVILGMNASRILSLQARFTSFVGLLLSGLIVLGTLPIWYEPLLHNVMEAAGKDTTITGRTYIWERGDVVIAQRPMLGVGYSAFWQHGSLEAEAIWRRMDIHNRSGFNFHNLYYDIRVHLGLVGVILFVAVCAPAAARLVVKAVRRPSSMTILFTALVLYEISRMNFESRGVTPFQYTTLLIFAAFAWSTRNFSEDLPGPKMRRRHRREIDWRESLPEGALSQAHDHGSIDSPSMSTLPR